VEEKATRHGRRITHRSLGQRGGDLQKTLKTKFNGGTSKRERDVRGESGMGFSESLEADFGKSASEERERDERSHRRE